MGGWEGLAGERICDVQSFFLVCSFFSVFFFFVSVQISCWVQYRQLSNTMFTYLQRGYKMLKSECWLRCFVCMSEFSYDLSIMAKHSKLGFWIIIIFTRKKKKKRKRIGLVLLIYLLLFLMHFIIHVVVKRTNFPYFLLEILIHLFESCSWNGVLDFYVLQCLFCYQNLQTILSLIPNSWHLYVSFPFFCRDFIVFDDVLRLFDV